MMTSETEQDQEILTLSDAVAKRWQCDQCDKNYKNEKNLAHHVIEKHGEGMPLKYQCDYPGCTEAFPVKFRLDQHKLKHSGKRIYDCQLCDQSFKYPGNLREHMQVHTGVKLFKCKYEGCDEKRSSRSMMTKHERKHLL